MTQSDAIRYERTGAAALVTIDRQERRNAVDGPTAVALHEAYLRFEADERGARAGADRARAEWRSARAPI